MLPMMCSQPSCTNIDVNTVTTGAGGRQAAGRSGGELVGHDTDAEDEEVEPSFVAAGQGELVDEDGDAGHDERHRHHRETPVGRLS